MDKNTVRLENGKEKWKRASGGDKGLSVLLGSRTLPEINTRRRSSAVRLLANSKMALAASKASLSGRLSLAPSRTWIRLHGFSNISLQAFFPPKKESLISWALYCWKPWCLKLLKQTAARIIKVIIKGKQKNINHLKFCLRSNSNNKLVSVFPHGLSKNRK